MCVDAWMCVRVCVYTLVCLVRVKLEGPGSQLPASTAPRTPRPGHPGVCCRGVGVCSPSPSRGREADCAIQGTRALATGGALLREQTARLENGGHASLMLPCVRGYTHEKGQRYGSQSRAPPYRPPQPTQHPAIHKAQYPHARLPHSISMVGAWLSGSPGTRVGYHTLVWCCT